MITEIAGCRRLSQGLMSTMCTGEWDERMPPSAFLIMEQMLMLGTRRVTLSRYMEKAKKEIEKLARFRDLPSNAGSKGGGAWPSRSASS